MHLNKKKVQFFLLTLIIQLGCFNSNLLITSEFIKKKSKELNGFQIKQIFPNDTLMPPVSYTESDSFKYSFLTDSTFKWENKIYFNKAQKGFKWVPYYSRPNLDTIGKLKNKSWYLFEGLHDFGYFFYVYIDSFGIAKTYQVNKSNW